jgi:hypothetical protein
MHGMMNADEGGFVKVWIVVTEHSLLGDSQVNGVFSTAEAAELFAVELGKTATDGTIKVEEFEVDTQNGKKAREVYECSVYLKGGSIRSVGTVTEFADLEYISVSMDAKSIDVRTTISMEHAIDVAKQKRKDFLKENAQPSVQKT